MDFIPWRRELCMENAKGSLLNVCKGPKGPEKVFVKPSGFARTRVCLPRNGRTVETFRSQNFSDPDKPNFVWAQGDVQGKLVFRYLLGADGQLGAGHPLEVFHIPSG